MTDAPSENVLSQESKSPFRPRGCPVASSLAAHGTQLARRIEFGLVRPIAFQSMVVAFIAHLVAAACLNREFAARRYSPDIDLRTRLMHRRNDAVVDSPGVVESHRGARARCLPAESSRAVRAFLANVETTVRPSEAAVQPLLARVSGAMPPLIRIGTTSGFL